jgi:hypothetical protein
LRHLHKLEDRKKEAGKQWDELVNGAGHNGRRSEQGFQQNQKERKKSFVESLLALYLIDT